MPLGAGRPYQSRIDQSVANMPIPVALTIVSIIVGITSPASAGRQTPSHGHSLHTFSFGCPSANDARAGNAIWTAKGYDAAWKVMQPKGCQPFLTVARFTIIYGGDEAKCVVKDGEMGPCVWVPADRIKAD